MSDSDADPDPAESPEPVATGDRREEAHVAPDPDQLFRAEFLHRPNAPPPPDQHTGRVDQGLTVADQPLVEDLRVAPQAPSVWDARPPEEPAEPAEPRPDKTQADR